MTAAAITIATVALVGLGLVWFFPEETRRWFNRAQQARALVFGLFSLAVALVFVASGSPMLMLIGGAMLLYGVLWLLLDDATGEIREVLPYL